MKTTPESVIHTEGLTKRFGAFTAVDHIDLTVNTGEIFGFLGANGAGKTTAMRMLTGLLKPTEGSAQVNGFDVYRQPENIKQTIGYMSQRFSLYEDLTLKENIRFFGGIYGLTVEQIEERGNALIERLHLQSVQDKLLAELPLGWKQKIAFSVATIHQPKMVFLDEPTGGVDPITRRQFWELIYEASHQGITILVTTHYMDEAEYCDRISIMVAGKIAGIGAPSELKAQFSAETMDDVFVKVARGDSSQTLSA
ncbi:ATP-binding cassette domain-containing protein [Pontibacter sp. G13]|uniref:ABC transporter ATP-binding protein n=1 Tax=Pontibacter sp. G13 TaxID=3074898 RepID=UPI00288B1B68|nr:ATP-binding cassette domain-containing protein [Pontibacter sp. G13]WNJ19892.1 ATP-binding cassette domain-containing protein [Pontibacter sp. G13]